MKQYITIAALIAAGATFASADDEQTISPFLNRAGWGHTGGSPKVDNLNNSYKWREGNTKGFSTYSAFEPIVLDSADDYMTFSYTHKTGTSTASVGTLALAGSEGAIVVGHSYSQAIGYGISMTNDADNYTFAENTEDWVETATHESLSPTKICTTPKNNQSYSIEGTISWDNALAAFVLNIAVTEKNVGYSTTFTSGNITLGDEFSIERLIIAADAPDKNSQVTYSNLALTWGHTNIATPEPSAFGLLAGLGALALAGTRRRRR